MYCCVNCFNDKFLKLHITKASNQTGDCSFCGQRFISVYEPSLLFDLFQPLFDLYDECTDGSGKDLNEQIQDDWLIFADPARAKLLNAICGNLKDVSKKYKPKLKYKSIDLDEWNKFREELKHINRYFPKNFPNREDLENLVVYLKVSDDETPKEYFRARINAGDNKYDELDMRKPPIDGFVPNGRANPHGIAYFYAASDENTAIHEVRPSRGDVVTVAHFRSNKTIALADLRNPRQTISPFQMDDNLAKIYLGMPYLVILGEELSKPIIPREADLEYLPSQYLCEFVKHMGFTGLIYRSSLAKGDNYALFEDKDLEYVEKEEYKIMSGEVKYQKLS